MAVTCRDGFTGDFELYGAAKQAPEYVLSVIILSILSRSRRNVNCAVVYSLLLIQTNVFLSCVFIVLVIGLESFIHAALQASAETMKRAYIREGE